MGVQRTTYFRSGHGHTRPCARYIGPNRDPEMPYQYGFHWPQKRWRSVTPIALPQPVPYARPGLKRSEFETQAASAVVQACRRTESFRVQPNPCSGGTFLLHGEPAHTYAAERFNGRFRQPRLLSNDPCEAALYWRRSFSLTQPFATSLRQQLRPARLFRGRCDDTRAGDNRPQPNSSYPLPRP
jgi:hypothetical protein